MKTAVTAKAEEAMTDFQFKQIIAMVYQILESKFEAGKSKEEILASIAALMKTPKTDDDGQQ
jgi:hypothetical protein